MDNITERKIMLGVAVAKARCHVQNIRQMTIGAGEELNVILQLVKAVEELTDAVEGIVTVEKIQGAQYTRGGALRNG